MSLDDIPGVLEIDTQSFSNPWPKNSFLFEISENINARNWIATIKGELCAMAILWKILDEIHIGTIAVHPDFRKLGVGSQFLGVILVHSRQEGVQRAYLEVRASNQDALDLYKKFGFLVDGNRKHYYHDNGEDALLMSADLMKNKALDQYRPFATALEGE